MKLKYKKRKAAKPTEDRSLVPLHEISVNTFSHNKCTYTHMHAHVPNIHAPTFIMQQIFT